MPSSPPVMLALRRCTRSIPLRVPNSVLPARFTRHITIQKSPSDPEHPDPSTFSYLAAASSSSSNHPYASIDSPLGPSEAPDGISTAGNSSVSGSLSGSGGDSGSSSSSSEAGPSSNRSISVVTNLPSPPEHANPFRRRGLAHPFDSYAFVQSLKSASFKQAPAEAVMEAVRSLVVERGDQAASRMLSQEDRENQSYLFRAALAELRTELSVRARNDSLALKAASGAIRREVDQLEQKMKEDVETLRHDIELDTNNRKAETRAELKGFNLDIEEINNKFTISLGDLRTEIEAAKWEQTRRAVAAILVAIVFGVFLVLSAPSKASKKAAAAASTPAPAEKARPVMRDMAVGTDEDLMLDLDEAMSDERLERILNESGVSDFETAAKRVKSRARNARQSIDVDRI